MGLLVYSDEGWAAPTLAGPEEQVPSTGWAFGVPEEVPTTNRSRDLGLQGPLWQPSSSVATPGVAVAAVSVTAVPVAAGSDTLAGTSDAHLEILGRETS